MRLIVFSDDSKAVGRFAQVGRSRAYSVDRLARGELKKILSKIDERVICYIDCASSTQDVRKVLKESGSNESIRVGIIDQTGSIGDVAELFHLGAVDYLGPELMRQDIPAKRIRAALDHRPFPEALPAPCAGDTKRWKAVPDADWIHVKAGNEYTFIFLYIEIDLAEEWRKKSGKEHLNEVRTTFHKHVERELGKHNGKVWMWTDHGGIVLVPFDGSSCPIVESCMKLIFDRIVISAELYPYNMLITYRMAIHIGNTIYHARGNTGTLISDTVNFIFHLGQKYLERGNLFLTEPVIPFIHPGLKACFVPADTFEGTGIHRMRLPRG